MQMVFELSLASTYAYVTLSFSTLLLVEYFRLAFVSYHLQDGPTRCYSGSWSILYLYFKFFP